MLVDAELPVYFTTLKPASGLALTTELIDGTGVAGVTLLSTSILPFTSMALNYQALPIRSTRIFVIGPA